MTFDKNLINNPSKGMLRLQEIMRALRDPEGGCPWDIEQNFSSIAPYTVEEAYEVLMRLKERTGMILKMNWEIYYFKPFIIPKWQKKKTFSISMM